MVDTGMLIGGIIALVIGFILYAIKPELPVRAQKISSIGGMILAVIGIVLIILAVLLPYI
jgi:hypothetical protein